jgi:simple sugar transport system permease protein
MDFTAALFILKLALITATPLALGAYAGIMCERSGVTNIAIEGMMLTSAMVGQLITMYASVPLLAAFGNPAIGTPEANPAKYISLLLGLAGGLGTGALLGLLHGVVSIRFKADQIISGTVINILALGLTGWVYQRWMSVTLGAPTSPGTFDKIPIPFLSKIPIIGDLLFNHQPVVYTMMILTFVLHYMLFYTRWGLRTRAVGEHPRAADTVGIDVFRMRYINTTLGGMIAGLAGVWLTLEWVGTFNLRMTAGRGFIALAAMIFGRWTPFGAFGAALLFGVGTALQTYTAGLQSAAVSTGSGSWLTFIPSQAYQAIPYLLTVIILAGFGGRATPPAADGQPYEKQ